MKNNIGAFKKKWIENPSDEKGVLLYLPVSEVFISAKFGTGENLLKEDITRGFDDCEESIEMIGNSSEEEYWILQMI